MAIQPIACHRRRRTRYLLAGVCPVGIIDGMEFGGAVGGSCERVERRSSTFSFMLSFGGQVRDLYLEAVSGLDICLAGFWLMSTWDFDIGDEQEPKVADAERSVLPVQRSDAVTNNLLSG